MITKELYLYSRDKMYSKGNKKHTIISIDGIQVNYKEITNKIIIEHIEGKILTIWQCDSEKEISFILEYITLQREIITLQDVVLKAKHRLGVVLDGRDHVSKELKKVSSTIKGFIGKKDKLESSLKKIQKVINILNDEIEDKISTLEKRAEQSMNNSLDIKHSLAEIKKRLEQDETKLKESYSKSNKRLELLDNLINNKASDIVKDSRDFKHTVNNLTDKGLKRIEKKFNAIEERIKQRETNLDNRENSVTPLIAIDKTTKQRFIIGVQDGLLYVTKEL